MGDGRWTGDQGDRLKKPVGRLAKGLSTSESNYIFVDTLDVLINPNYTFAVGELNG
jgi:hypothetical protein